MTMVGLINLKVSAVSDASKNHIGDSIQAVDPTYADLKHASRWVPVSKSTPYRLATIYRRPESTFTVTQAATPRSRRRTAWAIQNNIKVGQQLIIPAA